MTFAFLGIPKQRGDKIRIGCLTLPYRGTHKWAEMLHDPCILRDPETKRDKITIGCLTPAFRGGGGAQMGGNGT